MEKKVFLDESFYGVSDVQAAPTAACSLAFSCPAVFGICTIFDKPTCVTDTPCSDTCSDTPCSDKPQVSVDPWSWTASNGSASAAQTRNAYAILNGTRAADDFSHLVWNDLVDKVMEMRAAKGYTWDRDSNLYPTQSGCKVSAREALSARKYNGVRYNIGSVRATGIFDVSPGDGMTGYHIARLAEVLNEIINSL